jgi:hypothetical protein
MKCIYAIRLLNNKYYVGSTYDIYYTLKHIFSSNTVKDPWLVQNKPICIDKVVHDCTSEDEYKYLLKYIRQYGVANVRGPTFDSFVHERESLREINELNELNEINEINELNELNEISELNEK